jgi:hypothetical protein
MRRRGRVGEAWKEIGAQLLRCWNDTHCIENSRSHVLNPSRLESRFNFYHFFLPFLGTFAKIKHGC